MRRTLTRLVAALVIAVALVVTAPKVQAFQPPAIYSGYFYTYGWWWPFCWCVWHYTDFGNGNYSYWDTCGYSYAYLSLN